MIKYETFILQIYAMTLRMSELFEDNVKPLLSHYKYIKKRGENRDGASKKRSVRSTRTNGAGPSTSQDPHNSGESDDDTHGPSSGRANERSRRAHAQSNGVSSSSNLRESQQANKRSRQQRFKSSADESNSSESSSESSDNSDASSGIPLADLGKTHNKAGKKTHKKRGKKQKRGAVSSSSPKKNPRNGNRGKVESEDGQNDNESEESKSERTSPEPTTSRRSNRNQTKRRIHSSSDDNSGRRGNDEKRKRVCRRPKRYESDQSFHIDGTNKKTTADSDSDKPRATRESAKKKFIEWALTSEEDDGNDDDFDQKPQTSSQAQKSAARKSARKKVIQSESDQSDDKKLKPPPSRRSARTQRHSQSQSQEDESDDSDQQNRPSTSTNVKNNARVNGQPPVQTSTSSRTTRSSQNQPSSRGNNDHNYGEPGPSSTANAPPRQTRSTILSRHQRNADELDRSGLEDSSLASTTQNTRLLRLRSANLAAPTPTSNFEALNGIRRTTRTRVMHNYFEEENDNADEETVRFQPSHQNQSRSRTTRSEQPINNPSDDSDSYSEEDKTPLKLVASSNSKKSHEHNTRNGTAVARVKRNLYSDEEQVGPVKEKYLASILNLFFLGWPLKRSIDSKKLKTPALHRS